MTSGDKAPDTAAQPDTTAQPDSAAQPDSRHGQPDEPLPEGEEEAPPGTRVMAMVRWALVALMALAAFASLGHYLGWFDGRASSETGTAAATIYYCPMHPGVQEDHPGECPICSMTLVPKSAAGAQETGAAATGGMQGQEQHGAEPGPRPSDTAADEHAGHSVPGLVPITLTPERIQLTGMRTAQVTRQMLTPRLRTVGVVAASEKGLAVVQTRFAGWIEELKVQETGQAIARGQVLATIYSPELLIAQQELLGALKWSQGAGAHHDGGTGGLSLDLAADARRRLELLGISRAEIQALERTGKPVRALAIRSPVSGHVIAKNALKGLYVEPGTELFQLADLSTVWVLADVYEHEIGRITRGQKATLTLAAYPGETFTGTITFIYPTLDANTRTLRVRLALANKALRLKPGMYGDVHIELGHAEGLLVPAEAVVDTGDIQYVFIAGQGGRFEPRRVRLGSRAGAQAEIVAGVEEGEVVVTTANFLLDSESRLQATAQGAAPAGQTARDVCDTEFDAAKFPDKHQQCVACRAHRGMGSMEEDCRRAIPRPWK